MKIFKYILITFSISSLSYGKDNYNISLKSFVDNLRKELIMMEKSPEREKLPLLIQNVKVELTISSKLNAKGGVDFYIFTGNINKESSSSQKITFNIVKDKNFNSIVYKDVESEGFEARKLDKTSQTEFPASIKDKKKLEDK